MTTRTLRQLTRALDRWTAARVRAAANRVRQVLALEPLAPTIQLAPRTNGPRRCRACGCIDSDRVCRQSGVPCFWVADDLCSACATSIV